MNISLSYRTLNCRDIWIRKSEFVPKKLSLCFKLWFSNPYILATKCLRPKIFQFMNSFISNNLSSKFPRFTSSGCKDIIGIFEDSAPLSQTCLTWSLIFLSKLKLKAWFKKICLTMKKFVFLKTRKFCKYVTKSVLWVNSIV